MPRQPGSQEGGIAPLLRLSTLPLKSLLLGLGGAAVLLLLGRGGWVFGFLLGTLASVGNLQLLIWAVAWMTEPKGSKRPKYLWMGLLFRLLLMGLFLFLAVRVLSVNVLALAGGLMWGQLSILGLLFIHAIKTAK